MSRGDFNVFEGRTVRGGPAWVLSGGKVVCRDGELMVEKGAGKYVARPPFPPLMNAMTRARERGRVQPVNRA